MATEPTDRRKNVCFKLTKRHDDGHGNVNIGKPSNARKSLGFASRAYNRKADDTSAAMVLVKCRQNILPYSRLYCCAEG